MKNPKNLLSRVLACVTALALSIPAFAAVEDTGFSDVDAEAQASRVVENGLSGKVVAPFCTSSYSPITNSLHVFRELASGAAVVDGLTANSESAVRPWVDQVLSRAEQ